MEIDCGLLAEEGYGSCASELTHVHRNDYLNSKAGIAEFADEE